MAGLRSWCRWRALVNFLVNPTVLRGLAHFNTSKPSTILSIWYTVEWKSFYEEPWRKLTAPLLTSLVNKLSPVPGWDTFWTNSLSLSYPHCSYRFDGLNLAEISMRNICFYNFSGNDRQKKSSDHHNHNWCRHALGSCLIRRGPILQCFDVLRACPEIGLTWLSMAAKAAQRIADWIERSMSVHPEIATGWYLNLKSTEYRLLKLSRKCMKNQNVNMSICDNACKCFTWEGGNESQHTSFSTAFWTHKNATKTRTLTHCFFSTKTLGQICVR